MTTTLDRDVPSDLMLWAAEAEAAAQIARSLAGTAFVPASLKVRVAGPDSALDLDATVAQVAAALLTGQELGFGPMASLRAIDIIPPGSGSPALRAVALRALIQQHGHEVWVEESSDSRAIVLGLRAGSDHVQRSVWTIDRATALKIPGFAAPQSPWQRQPQNMLIARATAETSRLIAADVMLGLPLISEELDEYVAGLAATDGEAAPLTAGRRPRRATTGRVRQPRAGGAALALAAPAPPPGAASEARASGPAAPAPRISAGQRARLWAGLKALGLTQREDALAAVSGWVGRPVTSSNALTEDEAATALRAIAAERARLDARQSAEDAQGEAEASQEAGPDDQTS